MIRILRNLRDVDEATSTLDGNHLPFHQTTLKNWDHSLLAEMTRRMDRSDGILDMGCGEGYTVWLLSRMGFQNVFGTDLVIPWRARGFQLQAWCRGRSIRLWRGDCCSTGLPSGSIGAISCLSVIEHGVPLKEFARESVRVLKPGGTALITTDYWSDFTPMAASPSGTNMPWEIQNQAAIERLIGIFQEEGLVLLEPGGIPECEEKAVRWAGQEYTFLALGFRKATDRA
jgi:SAM-dependent methyltransferase